MVVVRERNFIDCWTLLVWELAKEFALRKEDEDDDSRAQRLMLSKEL